MSSSEYCKIFKNTCFWYFKTATEHRWAAGSILTFLLSSDNLLTVYEQPWWKSRTQSRDSMTPRTPGTPWTPGTPGPRDPWDPRDPRNPRDPFQSPGPPRTSWHVWKGFLRNNNKFCISKRLQFFNLKNFLILNCLFLGNSLLKSINYILIHNL